MTAAARWNRGGSVTQPSLTLGARPALGRDHAHGATSARAALPEAVAFAAHQFIVGALLDNPQRVGKRLHAPLEDRHGARRGTYRVTYRIDDAERTVTVLDIAPRRGVHRVNR